MVNLYDSNENQLLDADGNHKTFKVVEQEQQKEIKALKEENTTLKIQLES